jgi:hypothetical protein
MQRLLIITFFALLLQGCDAPDKALSQKVVDQFDNPSSTTVDLRNVVTSDWERFCVIGPYATDKSIEERIGFHWAGLSKSTIGENDSINLLVFIKSNSVVAFTEHPRGKGDFLEINPKCLRRSDAVLFKQKGKDGWGQLVVKEQIAKP